MQQGIERDSRGREHPVGLRVGLSGGEVSREDDDYFGDPVIEAARLCARCASGQVLAADIVRLTAGRRSRHECRSLGRAHLEGPARSGRDRRGAVGAARRGRRRAGRAAARRVWPCARRSGVVGRDAELAAMLDAFKRVAAGEGREVFLVSGEAGLGKTTAGRGGGPGRVRRRGVRVVRALRGGPRHSLPAVRRSARPLRHPRPRGAARRPRRRRGVRSWPGWSRRLSSRLPGLGAVDGDRC